ncbi:helix-turn-helix transcriptional regulator [Aquibium carbonis]|nr:LuxR C-terminal-related transcriptional regulator [Aquibium carbonis]
MNSVSRAVARTGDFSLSELDMIRTLGDAHDVLNRLARDHGFAHHAVLRFSPEPETRPMRQLVVTSFSREVVQNYERAMLASGSRALSAARGSVRPFAWDRKYPKPRIAAPGLDDARAILARVGVTMGMSLPVAAQDCNRGLVMLGGERSTPTLAETALLSLFVNGVFDRIVAIQNEDRYTHDFRLTPRERQCLMWTGAGKSTAEIARILELSEHTVNQHIATCAQKLGAVNRTQAVAKAIRLRVID